jgi:hypothetical protein
MSYKSFVPIVVNDDSEKVSLKQVEKGVVDATSDREAAVQSLTSVIEQAKMIDKPMDDFLHSTGIFLFDENIESNFDSSVIFRSVYPSISMSKKKGKERIVVDEKKATSLKALWEQMIHVSEALTMTYEAIWANIFAETGNQEWTDTCVKLLDGAKAIFWKAATALDITCHAHQSFVQLRKDFQSKYDENNQEKAAWQAWCSTKAENDKDWNGIVSNENKLRAWCASRERLMDRATDLEIARTELMTRLWSISKACDKATITFVEAYQIWKKAYRQILDASKVNFWGIQTKK